MSWRVPIFTEDGDKAIIDLVENDNLEPFLKYARQWRIEIPEDEKAAKAALCNEALWNANIPRETREKARKKCIELGYTPEEGVN